MSEWFDDGLWREARDEFPGSFGPQRHGCLGLESMNRCRDPFHLWIRRLS